MSNQLEWQVEQVAKKYTTHRQTARCFAAAGNISEASRFFAKALAASDRGSGTKARQLRAALLGEHSACLARTGNFAAAYALARQSLHENPDDKNMCVLAKAFNSNLQANIRNVDTRTTTTQARKCTPLGGPHNETKHVTICNHEH